LVVFRQTAHNTTANKNPLEEEAVFLVFFTAQPSTNAAGWSVSDDDDVTSTSHNERVAKIKQRQGKLGLVCGPTQIRVQRGVRVITRTVHRPECGQDVFTIDSGVAGVEEVEQREVSVRFAGRKHHFFAQRRSTFCSLERAGNLTRTQCS
jgi:hypothetical protein